MEFGTRNLCTVLTRKDTVLSGENRKQTVFVDVTPRDSCLRVFNAPFITYSRRMRDVMKLRTSGSPRKIIPLPVYSRNRSSNFYQIIVLPSNTCSCSLYPVEEINSTKESQYIKYIAIIFQFRVQFSSFFPTLARSSPPFPCRAAPPRNFHPPFPEISFDVRFHLDQHVSFWFGRERKKETLTFRSKHGAGNEMTVGWGRLSRGGWVDRQKGCGGAFDAREIDCSSFRFSGS